jgi:hypothetical protein
LISWLAFADKIQTETGLFSGFCLEFMAGTVSETKNDRNLVRPKAGKGRCGSE